MRLEPRDYQKEAIDAIIHWNKKGKTGILAQLGTGLGKTSGIVCNLPHYYPEQFEYDGDHGGMLFLSHRREILFHAYRKVKAAYPDRSVGIEMGEYHCVGYEDFIFASIDSIGRYIGNRINKFEHRYFSAIVCDEGHHVTENGTWDNILTYFGVGSESDPSDRVLPDGRTVMLLFLTATPERDDDKSIAPFLDHCDPKHGGAAFTMSLVEGVREGWLTDIVATPVIPEEDLSDLDNEVSGAWIARVIASKCKDDRTLVFAKSVEESVYVAEYINRESDLTAAHIDHTTDKKLREEYIRDFETGKINVITNRLIFTEGTDLADLSCIVDSAPTKNKSLFLQKIGRGVRPHSAAQVDACDDKQERREAIENSPKPHLRYIPTFVPSREAIGLTEAFTGLRLEDESEEEGRRIIEEIVDVVEIAEEEQPERKLTSVDEARRIAYREVDYDIWTQTIYNESLRRVSDNRWLEVDNRFFIYLPKNPNPKSVQEHTPVVWMIDDGQMHEILFGGWNEKLKSPMRPRVLRSWELKTDPLSTIVSVDRWLQRNAPELSEDIMLTSNEVPPTQKDVDYVKRNLGGVGEIQSDRTAKYLKDYYRIQKKINDLGL
jgi:superfamily II DNA or RNA helicase